MLVLTRTLSVSLEELLGDAPRAPKKHGLTPRLHQRQEHISQLPRPKRRLVMEMLEAVLAQPSR